MRRIVSLSVIHYTLALALVLTMAGCRSSKKTVKEDTDVTSGASIQVGTSQSLEDNIVASVAAGRQTAQGLRSKVSVKLSYAGKSASTSGQLKMKRDEIIQVSITALGIMELGRLELTPQHLLVLDRVNNQYLQVAWSDVPDLAQAGVDFSTFQALFWNELFVPGISGQPAPTDFNVERASSQMRLIPKSERANMKKVAVEFLVGASNSLIEQTNVKPSDGKAKMNFQCTYSNWTTLDQKKFPREMYLSVLSGSSNYALTLTSTNPQVDESMGNINTRVPSGYRQVTLDQIMSMMAK